MKYSPAFKKKETLSRATAWVNLENIILSEISESQKDKYRTISFYEVCKAVKFL